MGFDLLVDCAKLFFFDGVFLFVMLFLIVQHLFQSEEVLTCLFIEFLVDVLVDVDESRDDHMLQGVHTSVRNFDFLVQSQK